MPWIQNISYADVQKGHHIKVNENSMLIQIVDPAHEVPEAMYADVFAETHVFEFLDLEEKDFMCEEFKITDEQARDLVKLLRHALTRQMDVVVHCTAGICRSGAVTEVGVMMGFHDTETFRSPNLLVKHKMMKVLGWTYDEDEEHTYIHSSVSKDIFMP